MKTLHGISMLILYNARHSLSSTAERIFRRALRPPRSPLAGHPPAIDGHGIATTARDAPPSVPVNPMLPARALPRTSVFLAGSAGPAVLAGGPGRT